MEKKGQAAAFIIIGVIILIFVIVFMTVKTGFLRDLFEKISVERRAVPQQIKPLQEFIGRCVEQASKEGAEILGRQGGYISIQGDDIPITQFSPLGPSLEIIPSSGFRTAVWYRERGNGIQEIGMPSKQIMEEELADYISLNFAECLSNLTSFSEQGYLIEADAIPKTTARINERSIEASVEFPINVRILDTEFTLSEHGGEVDSNLWHLYNMAKEIMEKENNNNFLEEKTIDMLVAYNEEVPFTGTDLSCSEKTWIKSDVELKLKNILFENIAAMKIKGTKYVLNDEQLKYLEFDPLSTKDNTITANLMYIPDWPTFIEINPSEGNLLRSDAVSKKTGGLAGVVSSFFCLNTYRFVYDIKYPVMVTLTDEDGFSFQFATQVIIDNNQPKENRLEFLEIPETESPVCNFPQKEVSILTATLDKNEDIVPLDGVSLSYKCFPASCPLGDSALNPRGEPELRTLVPLCFNGVIEGSKEGYKQVQKIFYSSNDPEAPGFVLVVLEPVYTKEVAVKIIDKETGAVRDPFESEQINFQFLSTQANFQSGYIYPDEEINTIDLIPGHYTFNSYILREASTYQITFPKETIETCIDTRDFGLFGFFNQKHVCSSVETEPVEFDTVLTGGSVNVEHEFTREELSRDGKLTLYVLSSKIPSNQEELQRITIELETNKDHPLFRYPEVR